MRFSKATPQTAPGGVALDIVGTMWYTAENALNGTSRRLSAMGNADQENNGGSVLRRRRTDSALEVIT